MYDRYEIEWRELLIKRLKTVQAVLTRDYTAEEKRRTEAKELATGYGSYDEAHEAYGWAYITEKQLETIKAIFDNQENHAGAALTCITSMINGLKGDILVIRGEGIQERLISKFEEMREGERDEFI